jgi:hypothetical protein
VDHPLPFRLNMAEDDAPIATVREELLEGRTADRHLSP